MVRKLGLVGVAGLNCGQPGTSFRRARATRTSVSGLFTRQGPPVISAQPGSWYGFGPGLGDILREGGVYYQVFEGFSGATGLCVRPDTHTAIGLARSSDLVNWQVSAFSPILVTPGSSCGFDMPNWQVPSDGRARIVTPNSPITEGAPLQRWRIIRYEIPRRRPDTWASTMFTQSPGGRSS